MRERQEVYSLFILCLLFGIYHNLQFPSGAVIDVFEVSPSNSSEVNRLFSVVVDSNRKLATFRRRNDRYLVVIFTSIIS
jgi:hypothetical protein